MAISIDLSFRSKKDARSLTTYTAAITAYNESLADAVKLRGDMPIFIDTNVLLRYYSISFAARTKLLKFFNDYSDRIYLTNTVQKEFLRNREDVIERFTNDVTEQLPESFEKEIINKIDSFLNNNKVVLKDHVSTEKGLAKIKEDAKKLHEKLRTDIKKNEQEKISFWDKFLEVLNTTSSLDALSDAEIKIIKEDYTEQTKTINKDKIDSLNPDKIFPGLGDYKKKPEDPYGDYVIYHEMLSFMASSTKNAIFLTYDTTKADWIQRNGKPYLHYIENVYLNTKHVLYILDAERIFEDLLDMSFNSLIIETKKETSDLGITESTLTNFLINSDVLLHYHPTDKIKPHILIELAANGYENITQLKDDLSLCYHAIRKYGKTDILNKVGAMRAALSILNLNYIRYRPDGKPSMFSSRYKDKYNSYRDFLWKKE